MRSSTAFCLGVILIRLNQAGNGAHMPLRTDLGVLSATRYVGDVTVIQARNGEIW